MLKGDISRVKFPWVKCTKVNCPRVKHIKVKCHTCNKVTLFRVRYPEVVHHVPE
jgi:hypothetical protein